MNLSDFKYVEGAANSGYWKRNMIMKIDEVGHFRERYKNTGVYITAYRSNAENYRDGELYGDLYFDFDDEDHFANVVEDAQKVIFHLIGKYQIDYEALNIYFSGSKGIHIVINAEYLGVFPHKNLNQIFRAITKDIREILPERYKADKKGVKKPYKTLDLKIYDRVRMFRLINSIHEKSKLYKIPITFDELLTCSHEQIKNLAKQPREIKSVTVSAHPNFNKVLEEYRIKVEEKTKQRDETYEVLKLDSAPPCIKDIQEHGAAVGGRNMAVTVLASYFKQTGQDEKTTLANMLEWNSKVLDEPLEEREVTATVASVYAGKWTYGCTTLQEISQCDKSQCPFMKKEEKENSELPPRQEIEPELIAQALEESKELFPNRPCFDYELEMLGIINKVEQYNQNRGTIGGLTFGDKELDEAFCGLQPALYVLAGPPNIGKSMLALQTAWNVIKNNEDVYLIYFAIDDPDVAILPRLISIDQKIPINAAKIPAKYQDKPEILRRRDEGLLGLKKTIDRFKLLDKKFGYDVEYIKDVATKHLDHLKRFEDATGKARKLCIYIDNMYDVRTTKRGYSDPNSILQYVSEELDTYAEQQLVPVFCTGEMKKVNGSRRPILDDLKDTIELQYDASAVMLCYNEVQTKGERAEVYHGEEGNKQPILEVHVAKNKLGEFHGRMLYKLYPGFSHMELVDNEETKKYYISKMQN